MSFGDYLNARSNHLIDWNRFGVLFRSNHQYSTKQIVERGFIIASSAVAGFLAWNQNSSFWLGASLGFLISHTITMSPLIVKRLVAQYDCYQLKNQINGLLIGKDSNFTSLVKSVTEKALNTELSRGASAIWGSRRRLLTTLLEWLNDKNLPKNTLIDRLNDKNVIDLLNTDQFNSPPKLNT